jgi:aryl-alcohol dehydrogenase (NADP+)
VVPVEETMEALHDVVKAGKARYIGASSMRAWQFGQLQHAAELGHWTKFVSMQDQYSLLEREDEREMLPFCAATGVGVIPWGPLAAGYVARPWNSEGSGRAAKDAYGKGLYLGPQAESNQRVVEAVESVARERGVPMAQVALAWVASRPAVSAPIVGATRTQQLDDVIAALDLELTAEEIKALEDPYTPHHPVTLG